MIVPSLTVLLSRRGFTAMDAPARDTGFNISILWTMVTVAMVKKI
ncbi:hypothetical protein FHX77_000193 [Bifidobacterium commune]|nr:hypothetical protein [Bifidobacterium commune]